MRVLFYVALLASSTLCNPSPLNAGQEVLNNGNAPVAREKVPGGNPAYYSRLPKADQLFSIDEFIISPTPEQISPNTSRTFIYLSGSISSSIPQSSLNSATLTLTATVDGTTYEITEKISKHSIFSVRREGGFGEPRTYGGPLVEGENVLVGDMGLGHWGEPRKWEVRMEAVGRLGGEEAKILFAFEAEVEVKV